ncbi:hypothetical protein WDW86_22280 [Bdellovibrionota bacterium FG-2]
MAIQPKELAQRLRAILIMPFGGKMEGRYFISRTRLIELTQGKTIREEYVRELQDESLEIGIVLIEIGDGFCVIELSVLDSYRSVLPNIVTKLNSNQGAKS